MPSLLPGYTYDIFISYRHNDNRSGWVTDFVKALQEELASTLKDVPSIYFDTNPRDGLLETHNVDKSLEGKLKCLIFIPILSQTYCDPKSFAWQHEFCAYNQWVNQDGAGRDVRLSNGNVASRVLPVKIHDLDLEDKITLEKEIGGVHRAVGFIFRSPGVNRPLTPNDKRDENADKLFYRDQVNKVANAIKEILSALKNPGVVSTAAQPPEKPTENTRRRKVTIASVVLIALAVIAYFIYGSAPTSGTGVSIEGKSIAVLPFVDMSPSKDQEYLGDGIAEEIINVLTRIEGLEVIGRTSSFSFKGKNTDLIAIGNQLGAEIILEGSIRKANNQIRVTAQLIDAKDGKHLWSETYDRNLDDIFAIQDEISTKIADRFKVTLALLKNESPPTRNIEAYELYLQGRHALTLGISASRSACEYFEKAIALDPQFVDANYNLAYAYSALQIFGNTEGETARKLSKDAAERTIELDPSSYKGYHILSWLNFMSDWDWVAWKSNYEKALAHGLPQPDFYNAYIQAALYGRTDESIQIIKELIKRDPLSIDRLTDLSRMYLYAEKYQEVLATGDRVNQLVRGNESIMRHMGEAYVFTGQPEMAMPLFKKLLDKNPGYAPYGYVHALVLLGRPAEARKVISDFGPVMLPVKKGLCFIHLNELDSAFKYLGIAFQSKDPFLVVMKVDPNFKLIKNDPRYLALLRQMKFPSDEKAN